MENGTTLAPIRMPAFETSWEGEDRGSSSGTHFVDPILCQLGDLALRAIGLVKPRDAPAPGRLYKQPEGIARDEELGFSFREI